MGRIPQPSMGALPDAAFFHLRKVGQHGSYPTQPWRVVLVSQLNPRAVLFTLDLTNSLLVFLLIQAMAPSIQRPLSNMAPSKSWITALSFVGIQIRLLIMSKAGIAPA